jgi:hypothetical protein
MKSKVVGKSGKKVIEQMMLPEEEESKPEEPKQPEVKPFPHKLVPIGKQRGPRPKKRDIAKDNSFSGAMASKYSFNEVMLSDDYRTSHKMPAGIIAFRMSGGCTVFIGHVQEIGYHMTIGHKSRFPSWIEVHSAVIHFIPNNVSMALLLPPPAQDKKDLVNNAFHLYEIRRNPQTFQEAGSVEPKQV